MSQNIYVPLAPTGLLGRARNATLLAIFVSTLLLSSFLLFVVQPMFGKMVLPLLGGTPSVWNTAMLFFQVTLLVGYAYSHLIVSRLALAHQMLAHLVVLCLSTLALPLALSEGLRPPTHGSPVSWLLVTMAVTVGLPFFAVSTTAPLLQRWFSRTDHPSGADPYFLYAASNAGSLAALIGYPLVAEPLFALESQSLLWASGYVLLVGSVALSALFAWRRRAVGLVTEQDGGDAETLSWPRRVRWVALALVASSLMIGVTNHLSTDIAAIPMLWVIPLALYLGTFIVAFSKAGPVVHRVVKRVAPPLAILLLFVMNLHRPMWAIIGIHLASFFVIALAMHGELNKDRPTPQRLTEFYLWISVGGALGGVLNALVAPLLFDSVAEYPLMVIAGCLLALGSLELPERFHPRFRSIVAKVVPVTAFVVTGAVTILASGSGAYLTERNFFGIHKLTENDNLRQLVHGNTLHGAQNLDPAKALEPLTYYHRGGPAGQIFNVFRSDPSRSSVAIVGLGTGTLACYATSGQNWTFYEIDPAMERVAREHFSFLSGCGGTERIVIGDARLTLGDARHGRYDLIVIDAFNSDSIPVHLVTAEALDLYLDKLTSSGLLAFHVSNRYLDMEPVLAALAHSQGLAGRTGTTGATEAQTRAGKTASQWVLMTRDAAALDLLDGDERWTQLEPTDGVRGWTDSYSNVLSIFNWN